MGKAASQLTSIFHLSLSPGPLPTAWHHAFKASLLLQLRETPSKICSEMCLQAHWVGEDQSSNPVFLGGGGGGLVCSSSAWDQTRGFLLYISSDYPVQHTQPSPFLKFQFPFPHFLLRRFALHGWEGYCFLSLSFLLPILTLHSYRYWELVDLPACS